MKRWLDSLLEKLGHTRAKIEEQLGHTMEETQLEIVRKKLREMRWTTIMRPRQHDGPGQKQLNGVDLSLAMIRGAEIIVSGSR